MASGNTSKEYKLAIKIAGAVSSSFNSAVGDAGAKLTNLGTIAQKAAAVAAAAWGALKLGEFISSAVGTYQEFEQAMANTAAIAGATGEQYDALQAAALEMGKATSKSAKECADALGYMSLAGWDVNTSIASLEPVLRLSEATGMDLARCSDLVTDSMSALGVEAKDLAGYLDVAAMANNKSNQTAEMLMEAYIGVGGTMKNLNVPIQESAAALGVLANRGIKGSEAGTALNAVLNNLTTGTGQAGTMMKKLGISAFDSSGKFIGLEETIRMVSDATKGMTEEERNAALAAIGGKQHIDALNDLISGLTTTTADGVSEWQALSSALYNSEGAMASMAEAVTNTWQGANARLESAIDDLKINLVSTFAPYAISAINSVAAYIPRITEGITVAAQAFMDYAIPKIVTFKDQAVQVLGDIRPTLERIGSTAAGAFTFLAGSAGTALQSIGAVISSHSGLFTKLGQIALNVGGIISDIGERLKPVISYAADTALPQIVDAVLNIVGKLADLALIVTENKGLVIALVSAFAAFKGVKTVSAIADGFLGAAKNIDILTKKSKGLDALQLALNGKLSSTGAIIGVLTGKIDAAKLATGLWQKSVGSVTGAFTNIKQAATLAFTGLKGGIASIGGLLKGLFASIGGFLAANPAVLIIAAITAVIAVMVTLYNKCEWFRDKVNAILEFLKGAAQAAWERIKAALAPVVDFFQNDILPGIRSVWDSICGAFRAAWEFIKTIWSAVKPWFLAVWEVIKAIFSTVAAVLGGFFKAAWGAIQLAWSVVSPWFAVIWEQIKAVFSAAGAILGGFFKTAWEVIKAVWNSAAAFFQAIFDTIAGIFSAVTAVLHGDFSGAWEAIKGVFSSWGNYFQTIWDGIRNIFGAVGDWFGGIFSAAWNGVKNVFAAGLNAVRGSVSGFFSKLDELTGGAITRVAGFFSGLWDGIKGLWSGAAAWFRDSVITPLVNFFGHILETIGGIFRGLWIIIQAIWTVAAEWFQSSVITPIVNFFAPIVETIGGFFSGLWNGIQGVWTVVSGWFDTTVIQPLIEFFSAIPGTVSGFFSSLWSNIQMIWAVVSGWFDTTVIQPLIGFFAPIVETIGGFFASLWNNICSIWQAAGSWFSENVATPINNAFQSVGNFVKGVFNSVIGFVEKMINSVVSGINKFIGGFNGVVGKAASVVGIGWDGIASVPSVSLPRLAKGGIVDAPTILEAGEAGSEAIIPLGELWGQMREIVESAMSGAADRIATLASQLDTDDQDRWTPSIAELLDGLNTDKNNPETDEDPLPIMITYSPVYHFEGEAPSKEDLAEAEKMSQDEFNRMATQWLKDIERTRFRG